MNAREAEEILVRIRRDGAQIAARFGLRYRVIEAERPRVRRRYGACYADGTIRIRLRHATSGEPLKYSSLVNTLCHELAHLRHFNHGLAFRSLYAQILEYARDRGLYQPGRHERPAVPAHTPRSTARRAPTVPAREAPSRERGPAQLPLFGGGS
jgi:predicted metal-dependent hydrolase